MALSESRKKANEKWIKENYKQVKLSMPKKEALQLEEHCKKYGYTKAGFIREAIKDKISKDIESLANNSITNN